MTCLFWRTVITTVKILGSGGADCKKFEAMAREAATAAGVEAEFLKVTDMQAILACDVLATLDLVIDESGSVAAASRPRPRFAGG